MTKNESKKIRVSKLNAARRQLDCAIELWFADKDEVSVHTLAAAAHQIIHDIHQKKGGGELLFDSAKIKDEHRSEFISILKNAMNFFKHADKYAEEILEFPPALSEAFMLFSIMGLEKIGETANDTEKAFLDWLAFHRPKLMTETYRKAIEERFPINHLHEIRSLSKSKFFDGIMRARAEIRAKGLA